MDKELEKKLSLEELAAMLSATPEKLATFQQQYEKQILPTESQNFFQQNSRQAVAKSKVIDPASATGAFSTEDIQRQQALIHRAVRELVAGTQVYSFNGDLTYPKVQQTVFPALPDAPYISMEELKAVPAELRPMAVGNFAVADFQDASFFVLAHLKAALEEKDPKAAALEYFRFRQGLDIMDLDPILYETLGLNVNSMGHWLPQLVAACMGTTFFHIPATKIAKVPMPLLQLSRLDFHGINATTKAILDKWAVRVFDLKSDSRYFIKTGTYSSKFDFRNAVVSDNKEIMEIGEYLLYIHFQANEMAMPMTRPTVIGTSTTNEWVVREFIPDVENNPTIYKGLPLRTEYRVFIDCDTKEVLGIHPYWDPEGMKAHLTERGKTDPHYFHDTIIFQTHEPTMTRRYEENKDKVVAEVQKILPALDLTGQWSLDVMQNGDNFWLIDMARAEQSTFYNETVPPALRRPVPENWLPHIPEATILPPFSEYNESAPNT